MPGGDGRGPMLGNVAGAGPMRMCLRRRRSGYGRYGSGSRFRGRFSGSCLRWSNIFHNGLTGDTWPPLDPVNPNQVDVIEVRALRNRAENLQSELEALRRHLDRVESASFVR